MLAGRPRSLALALLLPLAACAGGETAAPQSFAPLSYAYLTPLHLDVANVVVDDQAAAQDGSDVAARSPVPPAQALAQMARDRIFPGGGTGEARFVIDQASIERRGDHLDGRLAVHLDLAGAGRSGHAEAQVSRSTVGGEGDLQARLYALTKQMMDDMNVEFEYQVRHSLQAWLQAQGDTLAPVAAQPLDRGTPGAPAASPRPAVPAPTPIAPPAPSPDVGPATSRALSPPPGFLTAPPGARPIPGIVASPAAPTPIAPAAPVPVPLGPTSSGLAPATPYTGGGYVPPQLPPPAYAPAP